MFGKGSRLERLSLRFRDLLDDQAETFEREMGLYYFVLPTIMIG